MDLDLGHGFIPRIGEENYKAVDRCVGPADLFNPDPLDLPWAIIDGAWAEGRPELLNTLRNHGTKLLVDTHGWRYRYGATSEAAKLNTTSWSPGGAVSLADKAAGRVLVGASVRAQWSSVCWRYRGPLPNSADVGCRATGSVETTCSNTLGNTRSGLECRRRNSSPRSHAA